MFPDEIRGAACPSDENQNYPIKIKNNGFG
jgi:hypothetical protein